MRNVKRSGVSSKPTIFSGVLYVGRAHQLRVTTTFTDAKTCRQLDAPGPFDRD